MSGHRATWMRSAGIIPAPTRNDKEDFGFSLLQRAEQKRTSPQTFSHFLRQENGRPQVAQMRTGRFDFLTPFGI